MDREFPDPSSGTDVLPSSHTTTLWMQGMASVVLCVVERDRLTFYFSYWRELVVFRKMSGKRKEITSEVISKGWKCLLWRDAVAKLPRLYELEKGKIYGTTS